VQTCLEFSFDVIAFKVQTIPGCDEMVLIRKLNLKFLAV